MQVWILSAEYLNEDTGSEFQILEVYDKTPNHLELFEIIVGEDMPTNSQLLTINQLLSFEMKDRGEYVLAGNTFYKLDCYNITNLREDEKTFSTNDRLN